MSNESVSVGIFMGSKSDLPIIEESAKVLSNFGVSYDLICFLLIKRLMRL